MKILKGQSVFRDICIGHVYYYRRQEHKAERHLVEDKEQEWLRFVWAREEAARQLRALYEASEKTVGAANAAIFEIHEMMLEDMEYVESIRSMIYTQGVNVEYAVDMTGHNMAQMLHSMEDDYMQERAADVLDISKRLLDVLASRKAAEAGKGQPVPEESIPQVPLEQLPEPVIVMADDLMPSETVSMPHDKVLGFVLQGGSLHSHTAILARSMGIPAVVAVGKELLEEYDGALAIIDGYAGVVYLEPDAELLSAMEEKREQSERHKALLHALKGQENCTRDGRMIKIYANAGSLADIDQANANDAGGIGLLRSEMLYLQAAQAPDEETQFLFYKAALEKMPDKEVVIRTMDIGADKQVDYLKLPKEENPALGYRAIRIGLEQPELLETQLRALYRAGVYGRLNIMYPMIASVEELLRLKAIEERVKKSLQREGKTYAEDIPIGIMIETPAAALISDELAGMVDFFSVGTNDLTQYTLAMDRQNDRLEAFRNTHHRAVLKLIEMAAASAHGAGIWIGICGELASDLELTEEFMRMGIDELSVAPSMILPLRERIREL